MEFSLDLCSILIGMILFVRTAESCTFVDPCMGVKCPGLGEECNWIFPYCTLHVCPPVATCSDPCQDVKCQSSEECVAVAEKCNEALCNITARCNVRIRPGRCPDEPRFLSSCTAQCQDDALCPKNYKCCNGFCIAPIL